MPDPSGAVAAILAVTPRSPLTGHTVVDFVKIDPDEPDDECNWGGVWGDPGPVAERQAAEFARWLADHAPADAGYVWHPRSLRNLADEIEAHTHTEGTDHAD